MKIISIVGARPNFMKVAPLHRAFHQYPDVVHKLVHTGQHADAQMSQVFFDQLALPKPDYHLGVHGGSPTQQTAHTMLAFEAVVATERPDMVLVVGDVNATLACALTAVKMGVPLAHVEAGLRSGDRRMPEELNRILTDSMSDLMFVTEKSGLENLKNEGISAEKVFFTGNCMVDSLLFYQAQSAKLPVLKTLGLSPKEYALLTMHRPSNVDDKTGLEKVMRLLELISPHTTVVFPIHPRTHANLTALGLLQRLSLVPNLLVLEPQGYLEFQQLMTQAALVFTDSGGIQEETTYLQVPCLTFRETTERPVTVEIGSNELISNLNPDLALEKVLAILNGGGKRGNIPPLWDGNAAKRIATVIQNKFVPKLR